MRDCCFMVRSCPVRFISLIGVSFFWVPFLILICLVFSSLYLHVWCFQVRSLPLSLSPFLSMSSSSTLNLSLLSDSVASLTVSSSDTVDGAIDSGKAKRFAGYGTYGSVIMDCIIALCGKNAMIDWLSEFLLTDWLMDVVRYSVCGDSWDC